MHGTPQTTPQISSHTAFFYQNRFASGLFVNEFFHYLKKSVHDIGNVAGQFPSFSHWCIAEVDCGLELPQHVLHFMNFRFHGRGPTDWIET